MGGTLNTNPRKLLLVTDAWGNQVNGVHRTWKETIRTLRESGDEVEVIHPGLFKKLPFSFYHDIDLVRPSREIFRALDHTFKNFEPNSVHIATPEGPLGLISKAFFTKKGIEYTTSYHTDIPMFLEQRPWLSLLKRASETFERIIHKGSQAVLAPTKCCR
jgi:hypothetical protein